MKRRWNTLEEVVSLLGMMEVGWKSDNSDEGFHYTFQDCIIKGYIILRYYTSIFYYTTYSKNN